MSEPLHIVCPACLAINRFPYMRLRDGPKCGKCHEPMFTATPVNLSESAFHKHLTANGIPLVVDFWAPRCGPCQSMAPALAQAATQLEPSVRLAKVNTDQTQQVSQQFGIRSIPTLVAFRNGREIARQPGAMAASDIVQWVRTVCV